MNLIIEKLNHQVMMRFFKESLSLRRADITNKEKLLYKYFEFFQLLIEDDSSFEPQ